MTRAIVNVATGPYVKGQERLKLAIAEMTQVRDKADLVQCHTWQTIPSDWPTHQQKPYAFKAYALHESERYADLLLWCDACILPVKSLEPLWERIERDGYWMSRNGWTNYEWTADSAYRDLFSSEILADYKTSRVQLEELNKTIPHVVATAFGINVKHPKGAAFLKEYYRLASETNAFCGPWKNADHADTQELDRVYNARVAPCGPPDVRGHRHDQTAASVIAWRLGFELTNPPEIFSYGKAGDVLDERTILLADGSY
jgi:hypothetical protein